MLIKKFVIEYLSKLDHFYFLKPGKQTEARTNISTQLLLYAVQSDNLQLIMSIFKLFSFQLQPMVRFQ